MIRSTPVIVCVPGSTLSVTSSWPATFDKFAGIEVQAPPTTQIRLVDLSNRDRGRDGRGNRHHRSARNRRISRRLREDRRGAAGDRRDRTIASTGGNRAARRRPGDTTIRHACIGVHGRASGNLVTDFNV
jgi:hypothetical protein